jgi:methylated-DNA-[protein]-cysteine S-methyltransferase
MNKTCFAYETVIGKVLIAASGDFVTDIISDGHEGFVGRVSGEFTSTRTTDAAAAELREYFTGRRRSFGFKIRFEGTPFQNKIWRGLLNIGYGETRSYRQLAEASGNSKAYRAVGAANNKNPLMFVIPCHRVIGADGSLVGYAGGLELKKFLLDLENKHKKE